MAWHGIADSVNKLNSTRSDSENAVYCRNIEPFPNKSGSCRKMTRFDTAKMVPSFLRTKPLS